jgi:hypothetical protein
MLRSCLQIKVPTFGSEIPALSLISAVRLGRGMNDVLAEGYKRCGNLALRYTFSSDTYNIAVPYLQNPYNQSMDSRRVWKIYRRTPSCT